MDSSIEIRRSAGRDDQDIVFDKDTAVNGPDGFELAVDECSAVLRGRAKTPRQFAVGSKQGIDPSVSRAEKNQALMNRRRRIDAPARDVSPERPSIGCVDGVNGVSIN